MQTICEECNSEEELILCFKDTNVQNADLEICITCVNHVMKLEFPDGRKEKIILDVTRVRILDYVPQISLMNKRYAKYVFILSAKSIRLRIMRLYFQSNLLQRDFLKHLVVFGFMVDQNSILEKQNILMKRKIR